jgi:serine/threonine-protein kinase
MYCSRCGAEVSDQAKFCPSCGLDFSTVTPIAPEETTEATEMDAVRQALDDEWGVEVELGRGGMAIVFKARDKHLERDVAIKVLPFSLAFDKQFVERFQREARTAARLEHPYIIPIYRVGKSGQVIYFVMKYLRGGSLSERLERTGKLRPDEIRRMLIETSGALGYAHRHGIVHRDIKPDNIMFDEMGHSILTDFGIAKAASGTRLTGTGMSIGTPHYMSPEQARAQQLDGRSDLYALGVVAYQCLTGEVPFDGEDAFSIGYKHIMEEIPSPALATPEARELYEVIRKMMAKAPDDRFQTAEEIAGYLQSGVAPGEETIRTSPGEAPKAVLSTPTLPAETPKPTGQTGPPTTPTTPIPLFQGRRRRKQRRGLVLTGVLTALFLGVGGAGGYWYFVLGAEWPPPLLDAWLADSNAALPGADDSLDVLAADSLRADSLSDSLAIATADSAAPVDSAVETPPATPLPPTGTLVLTGVPQRARWSLDGQLQTDTVLALLPRTYTIRVSRTNYETFETSVPVGRGERVRVPVPALVRLRPTEPAPPPVAVDYCSEPGADYNKDGSCFDTGPRPNDLPLIPLPAGVSGSPSAVLWVQVMANGQPGVVKLFDDSRRPRLFEIAAITFARREMTYTAATKAGRRVDSWLRLPVRGRARQ